MTLLTHEQKQKLPASQKEPLTQGEGELTGDAI